MIQAVGAIVPQLQPVKSSPLDDRFSSAMASMLSLEQEIENLAKQLEPLTVSGQGETSGPPGNAVPLPPECRFETAMRSIDARISGAWQKISALRAQLRV